MNVLTNQLRLTQNHKRFLLLYLNQRSITLNNKISNDPYYVIGVERSSSFPEIKRKYFALAKKYHPDLNPNDEVLSFFILLVCQKNVHSHIRSI